MKISIIASLLTMSASFNSIAECLDNIAMTTSTKQFVINSDGTVVDTKSRLMWSICSVGQVYSNKQCENEISKTAWSEALSLAQQSRLGGYTDWRLPNKNEFNSIIELSCFMPSIDTGIFPSTGIGSYWSSTPYDEAETTVWAANFATGNIFAAKPTIKLMVRFVRDH